MRTSLRRAGLALGLLWTALVPSPAAAPPAPAPSGSTASPTSRPELVFLEIRLDDGRSYQLTADELADARGGVLFWNDWAVYNILLPFYALHPNLPTSPGDLIRVWNTPDANGDLPAFLIKPQCIPRDPLAVRSASAAPVAPRGPRPKVVAILVGLQDGRSYSLSPTELHDAKSGVMFWGDFAIRNMLVPFYAINRSLPTKPNDVLRIWGTPSPLRSDSRTLAGPEAELPGFILKPQCIPEYPFADR